MPMTISDKIKKAKQKRTQSLMSKINILWTRDGCDAPEIESQYDIDFFNCQQLFGKSGTENIDWGHMGVEGLIRCYYHISYLLKGTVRNNIVRSNNYTIPSYCSCSRASLEAAANYVIAGNPQNSGFFSSDSTAARAGTLNYADSSFMSNRDSNPADQTSGTLVKYINDAIELIGSNSGLGIKTFDSLPSLSQLINSGTILGERNTDVYPYTYSVVNSGSSGGVEGGDITYTYTYKYGNGIYDTSGQIISSPYYYANPNVYNANLNTLLSGIQSIITTINQYIKYTEITDTTYFVSTSVIPGLSTNWAMQEGWINQLNSISSEINNYFSVLNQYYPYNGNSSLTNPNGKAAIDTALTTLAANLNSALTTLNSIHSTINTGSSSSANYGSGFFGDPNDKGASLWGARASWIKTIIDLNEGSRVTLKGISSVISTMNASITKAEDEFTLFGISKGTVEWTSSKAFIGGLTTPEILNIEYHQIIDTVSTSDTYLELINNGFTVSWQSTAHATGYDIWRSVDWNGTTGTWVKLLPAGNTFTVQDINSNNGQVYNYYNDLSVNTSATPYYKVKAYDAGGSGDYSRIPAESLIGTPYCITDFEGSGSSSAGSTNYPTSGGSGSSSGGSGASSGTSYTSGTVTDGSDTAKDPAATTWRSPVSNYSMLPTANNTAGDIRLVLSEQTLYFWNKDSSTWESLTGADASHWKDPVETISFLPTQGNSDGDVRLVMGTGKIYQWDSESSSWGEITGGSNYSSGGSGSSAGETNIKHSELSDMPDSDGTNTDHDSRYYAKSVMDTKLATLTEELDALKYLIPDDASPISGTLKLASGTYYEGYLSHGYTSGQRYVTLAAEQFYQKIVKNETITLTAASDAQFNDADDGVIYLYLNDNIIDTFDLGTNFNESKRAGNQTYTPATGSNGYLKITSVGMYNNYSSYQKGSFAVILDKNILVIGENSIKVSHILSNSTIESTNELIIFFDPSNDAISFDNFGVAQNKLISNKWLSGIRYYSTNDALTFSFQVNKLFNNTYIYPNQISVDASQFGVTSYYVNHKSSGSSYIDYGQPFIDAIMKSSETKTINNSGIYTNCPVLKLKGYNLLGASAEYTYSLNMLINTCPAKSNDLHEYFIDENYRMPISEYTSVPTSYKNLWNSSSIIGANDLQVYNGSLVYPRLDFTSNYLPAQTVNYKGYSGTKYYIRAFVDSGTPHNNGIIYLEGFDMSSNTNIDVDIKLPGITEWMSLTTFYNEADFNGYDGDGCLVNHDTYYYQFTTGKFSTSNSGYMILIRISMTQNNFASISDFSINW